MKIKIHILVKGKLFLNKLDSIKHYYQLIYEPIQEHLGYGFYL